MERESQWQDCYTAILIEGARRVGKSTLVETFAKNEYGSYVLIDFNKASKNIKALFDDLMNMDFLFIQIQASYNVVLKPRKSVITFDEVQNCPLDRQAIWDKDYTVNVIYQKMLSDKLDANLGYVYENMVAQMLASAGNKLFYYTFPKDEKHNYEIDFLLSHGSKIRPIEVKSSGYSTHVSLDMFCEKYSSRVDKSFLLYTKDLRKDGQTFRLPVLMANLL